MPAALPAWTNWGLRWGIAIGGAAILFFPMALMLWVRTPYVRRQVFLPEQPIPFDHRHHVVDDGIDCRYCHNTVERSSSAGFPPSELCMGCHNQIWADSPLLEPLRRSVEQNRPIAWARVYRLPKFVFFNHAVHVNRGVACEECHGRVDRMARIYREAPISMRWCLDCHRNPEPHLRPPDKITVMGWRAADAVTTDSLQYHNARPGTFCTSCHR